MNKILSICLYLTFSTVPFALLYVVFEGNLLLLLMTTYFLVSGFIYFYIDKIILILLKAREVIDADEQETFQCLKNESYKSFEKVPRIYLYSGNSISCLILEARNEWTVVMNRKLMRMLDLKQRESLAAFLFSYKKNMNSWYQTKMIGLIIMNIKLNHWIFSNVFLINQKSHLFRILSVFSLSMTRPFFIPFEKIAKRDRLVPANIELKPIQNQIEINNNSFEELMLNYFREDMNINSVIVSYIESFSVLNQIGIYKNEI